MRLSDAAGSAGWDVSVQGGQCQLLEPFAVPDVECLGFRCEFPPMERLTLLSFSVSWDQRGWESGQLPSPPKQVLKLQTIICNENSSAGKWLEKKVTLLCTHHGGF